MAYANDLSVMVELTEFASEEMQKLGLLVDQAIVLATPFKDGIAKSNWLMSLNEPDESINMTNIDKVGSYSINLARKVTEGYPKDSLPTIYISNNLPYIQRLNEGWSQQAGTKYVEAEIAQAVNNGR